MGRAAGWSCPRSCTDQDRAPPALCTCFEEGREIRVLERGLEARARAGGNLEQHPPSTRNLPPQERVRKVEPNDVDRPAAQTLEVSLQL